MLCPQCMSPKVIHPYWGSRCPKCDPPFPPLPDGIKVYSRRDGGHTIVKDPNYTDIEQMAQLPFAMQQTAEQRRIAELEARVGKLEAALEDILILAIPGTEDLTRHEQAYLASFAEIRRIAVDLLPSVLGKNTSKGAT